jgi:hypothetical protein
MTGKAKGLWLTGQVKDSLRNLCSTTNSGSSSLYSQQNVTCKVRMFPTLLSPAPIPLLLPFYFIFFQYHNISLIDVMVSPPGCGRRVTDFWGCMHIRRSYVVPIRWMVMYEYEVPGGTLNVSSTKLPWTWSPWESSLSRKNPYVRTGNRTLDLMISIQKLWQLDREAGPFYL